MLKHLHERIAEKAQHPEFAPVLIIPFGDSVTQGCMGIDVIDHSGVYHNRLKQMLELVYPQTTFSVYNAGVNGASASSSLARLDRDVIRHDPDLVILAFCLNDARGNLEMLDQYERNMRQIILTICSKTQADIIILTPNFMALHETPKIVMEHRSFAPAILACQNSGILKVYVEKLRELAQEFAIPLADVYAKWETFQAAGVDTTAWLINGLNHPDTERQSFIADTVFKLITDNELLQTKNQQ
jgi:lysophospholipase L1-like esterase